MINQMLFGNCFHWMRYVPEASVDMILCDLPYGVTRNEWDSVLDLDRLWGHYERIIKPNGAIVLTAQDKFSARLMLSNEKLHRYNLIWEKTNPSGHLNAKRMPMRCHEDILVFYKHLPTYNPQKTSGHSRKVSTATHKRSSKATTNYGKHGLTDYDSTERYPRSVLKFPSDKQKSTLNPTQKPEALCEYLIRTYTNAGDLVLDNCSGSGTTAVACLNTGRRFICMEKDRQQHAQGAERVAETLRLIRGGVDF